jgi:hypothetical protein
MTTSRPLIRASEIGLYAYCARAWWLQTACGLKSKNTLMLHAGIQRHTQHGGKVTLAYRLRILGYSLFTVALLLIVWGIGQHV